MSFFLDRRVPQDVLDCFAPDGAFAALTEIALGDRTLFDLQFRRKAWSSEGGQSWVTLYAGMSAVVTLDFNSKGVALRTHATYRALPSFDPAWTERQPVEMLAVSCDRIGAFTRSAADHVAAKGQFLDAEGRVHAALAAVDDGQFRTVNREVSIGFRSVAERDGWMSAVRARLEDCLNAQDTRPAWWPPLGSLGTGCDFLGIDDRGRLLAIEAKPSNATSGIWKGPLQVTAYAHLIRDWASAEQQMGPIVNGMLDQRISLGLTTGDVAVGDRPPVVPVLAIGAGKLSSEGMARARQVGACLASLAGDGIGPLEIWRLGTSGRAESIEVIG